MHSRAGLKHNSGGRGFNAVRRYQSEEKCSFPSLKIFIVPLNSWRSSSRSCWTRSLRKLSRDFFFLFFASVKFWIFFWWMIECICFEESYSKCCGLTVWMFEEERGVEHTGARAGSPTLVPTAKTFEKQLSEVLIFSKTLSVAGWWNGKSSQRILKQPRINCSFEKKNLPEQISNIQKLRHAVWQNGRWYQVGFSFLSICFMWAVLSPAQSHQNVNVSKGIEAFNRASLQDFANVIWHIGSNSDVLTNHFVTKNVSAVLQPLLSPC